MARAHRRAAAERGRVCASPGAGRCPAGREKDNGERGASVFYERFRVSRVITDVTDRTVPDEPPGGALEVEPSGEEGTMFSIRLPRHAADESVG